MVLHKNMNKYLRETHHEDIPSCNFLKNTNSADTREIRYPLLFVLLKVNKVKRECDLIRQDNKVYNFSINFFFFQI